MWVVPNYAISVVCLHNRMLMFSTKKKGMFVCSMFLRISREVIPAGVLRGSCTIRMPLSMMVTIEEVIAETQVEKIFDITSPGPCKIDLTHKRLHHMTKMLHFVTKS
jgi:hypothetical protein